MHFEIVFGGDPADVEVTTSGKASVELFRAINQQIAGDYRYRRGMALLIDHSALDGSALSDEQIRQAAESMMDRDWERPPRAVAVVATRPAAMEVVQQVFGHLTSLPPRRAAFATREEALAWLSQCPALPDKE